MSRWSKQLLALGVSAGLVVATAAAVYAPAAPAAQPAAAPHVAAPHARSTRAHPATLPYAVNLGYVDNVRADPANFPTPWEESPNVIYEGCTGSCEFDGGAVQVVNTRSTSIRVASVVIHYDTCVYDIWPHNVTVPANSSLIVTQTTGGAATGCTPGDGQMDSSDIGPGGVSWAGNCSQSGLIPEVDVTVGTVTTPFTDSGQVLNTGGVDGADCNPKRSNESEQWTPAGSSICPGSNLVLTPASVQKAPSASVTTTATFTNSCGNPLRGVPVNFDVTSGPDAGATGTATTNSSGKATFTVANDGTQGIDFVTASIDNTVGTITSPTSYLYFENASLTLTPTSGVPGDTVRFTGRNFVAGETVELHANSPAGTLLASKAANSSGVVTDTFVVPVPSGTQITEIVAVGLTSARQGWSLFAVGCTDDWAAPVSGDWNTGANWSTGEPPSASDVACIIAPGQYTVTMNESHSVAGLLLGTSGGTGSQNLVLNGRGVDLAMNGPSTILAHGVLTMTSVDGNYSMISGSGTLTNDGTLKTLNANGSQRYLRMNIVNDASGLVQVANFDTQFDTNFMFTNNGAVKVLGGGDLAVSNNATFVQSGGTVNVSPTGTLGFNGATVTASGGALTGIVQFSGTTLADTGTTGGTLLLRCSDTLSGTIAADQTADVRGDNCGTATLTLSGTVTNNGTVKLDATSDTSDNITGGALTNNGTFTTIQGNGGTRYVRSDIDNAPGGTAVIDAYDTRLDSGNTFTDEGALTIGSTGDLQFFSSTYTMTGSATLSAATPGSFYLQGSTYNDNGGTVTGTAYLNGSTLNEAGGTGGTVVLECGDTVTGTIAAARTLEVQGNGCGSATTTLSGTVVNNGTLTMSSTNGNSSMISGSPLTNNGTFSTTQGNGGQRYIRVDITNASGATATFGDFDSRQDSGNTFTNAGAVTVPAGGGYSINGGSFVEQPGATVSVDPAGAMLVNNATLADNGGTAGGVVALQNATLTDAGGTGGTYLLQCNDTLSGTVQSGQTVDVQGNGCGNASTTLDAAGVTNFGTVVLDSTDGNYALLSGGTLTNRGTLNLSATGGGTRYLRVAVVNGAGSNVLVSAPDTRQDSNTSFSNTSNGHLTIQDGGTLSLNGGSTFTQSATATLTVTVDGSTSQASGLTGGAESLTGTLKVTTVGTVASGTTFTVINNGSVTGTFGTVLGGYSAAYTSSTVTVTKT